VKVENDGALKNAEGRFVCPLFDDSTPCNME